MKNFIRLGDFNFEPLLTELARNGHLWRQHPFRTTFPGTPHSRVDDIILRFPKSPLPDPRDGDWFPAYDSLEHARLWIHAMVFVVRGSRIGRSMITRLGPGEKITPHQDYQPGPPDYYWNRFHGVIQGGGTFTADDEVVEMPTNTVWWFQQNSMHSVHNTSDRERLHIICDIQCRDDFKQLDKSRLRT